VHRTPTIARAALAGTLVGTAAAVVLWALVAVVTASGEHDAAAGLAAAALAVAPVVAVAGWILAVVEVLTARRWAVVTTAAVLAAVAAFVSAVTGLVFPTLGEHPFAATYPIVGGFATSVAHLPLAAVLVTVVLWAAVAAAVAGAVTTAVARGRDRGGRASRPV